MEDVSRIIRERLSLERGFEVHPFLVGWYNGSVSSSKFALPYDHDVLAYVVISLPRMFEETFIPFVASQTVLTTLKDPLDQCLQYEFGEVKERLSESVDVETIHDFEVRPNRRPKVLVQTAGHVSGAVRLYRPTETTNDKKMFSVCLHPEYGGWFALRGVFIFPGISVPDLERIEPINMLDEPGVHKLLILYNRNWKDGSFRDVIPVKERYSTLQRQYFETKPEDRIFLLERILEKTNRISR